jgi:glycosyltransferase involved in cell wall biosynthesis
MAPALGTVAALVKKWSKAKVVSIVDNIIPHEKRPGDKFLAGYFVNRVDGFIAMSESVLADLRKFDGRKPMIFHPHPLYDNFGEAVSKSSAIEHLGLDITTNYLLFFGFIRDYKGLDLLLRAMAEPEIRNLQIKLIVAGEFYTDAQVYLDLIEELKIQDLLVWKTDFIPDQEVRYYFCAADLVVQPYKHATQSGVTQICYHFDRPMLVTRVGGLPEIVPHGEAGYVTEPDPADIAAHIIRFYREHREFVFRDNIKILKQKYSWKKMVAKILELLPH